MKWVVRPVYKKVKKRTLHGAAVSKETTRGETSDKKKATVELRQRVPVPRPHYWIPCRPVTLEPRRRIEGPNVDDKTNQSECCVPATLPSVDTSGRVEYNPIELEVHSCRGQLE